MSLMDRGAAALVRQMSAGAGRQVVYTRDAGKPTAQTVQVTAWVGNTLFARNTDEPGASVAWGERDYFVPCEALVLGGAEAEPRTGDKITETIRGADVTFEVRTAPGEPAYRLSEQTRLIWRLHCKRV